MKKRVKKRVQQETKNCNYADYSYANDSSVSSIVFQVVDNNLVETKKLIEKEKEIEGREKEENKEKKVEEKEEKKSDFFEEVLLSSKIEAIEKKKIGTVCPHCTLEQKSHLARHLKTCFKKRDATKYFEIASKKTSKIRKMVSVMQTLPNIPIAKWRSVSGIVVGRGPVCMNHDTRHSPCFRLLYVVDAFMSPVLKVSVCLFGTEEDLTPIDLFDFMILQNACVKSTSNQIIGSQKDSSWCFVCLRDGKVKVMHNFLSVPKIRNTMEILAWIMGNEEILSNEEQIPIFSVDEWFKAVVDSNQAFLLAENPRW